jgi:hypothetical protein
MPDPARNLDAAPGPLAAPDDHRHRIVQLANRELDLYANQLARCLQALGTTAPIRADIQRELGTVRAEQVSRASAIELGRAPDVSELRPGELERARRELQASLALARPGSPMRGPILAHLSAIDTEQARRTAGQLPDPPRASGRCCCSRPASGPMIPRRPCRLYP